MAKKHGISWLNVPGYKPQTWNPIVGCSKVSEGCRNCYAERMAKRLSAMGAAGYTDTTDTTGRWNGQTALLEEVLEKPLGWKKPRVIFVNSMGDLFHENTPSDWVLDVLDVIERCPQHLFIVLTKRAEQMHSILQYSYYDRNGQQILDNVWLGVTAENQEAADERIPHLLSTPAAVRFVSCEPMIGAVDFDEIDWGEYFCKQCHSLFSCPKDYVSDCCGAHLHEIDGTQDERCSECGGVVGSDYIIPMCPECGNHGGECWIQPDNKSCFRNDEMSGALLGAIDWIICGGESGPGARAMSPDWARELRDQCQAAGVPFFFKQHGDTMTYKKWIDSGYDPNAKRGGDALDGRQWHEWPKGRMA